MSLIVGLFPGIALASILLFGVLFCSQIYIYKKTKSKRSLYIAAFCFFGAMFSFETFMVHARLFSVESTLTYLHFSQTALFLSLYYYLQAMAFFVAIPNKLLLATRYILLFVIGISILWIPYYLFFSESMWFDSNKLVATGNYFVDSYSLRIGEPRVQGLVLLSIFSVLNILFSSNVLVRVLKGSKDYFLIAGLSFSIIASLSENVLLPFTFEYFVPLIFISNMFEAARMSFLSVKEYILVNVADAKIDGESKVTEYKYQNINLSQERISELVSLVRDQLENEQIYLNPNLRLEDLARKVSVPSYQLTQVLHLGFNKGFYDLINGYRIEKMKSKLLDKQLQNQNIMDLAYETGFNSKSTFNTAFKKLTKMTPSEYRKSVVG